MTIKPLTIADLPELRELAIRIFTDTFSEGNTPENMEAFIQKDYSVEAFTKDFQEDGASYYFAMDGDKPAGYLRLRRNPEVEHILGNNTLELQRIYVDFPYHGKGVADMLMKQAIDEATRQNVDWLWLGVWEHNPRAQRFYQKWGFEKFSEHIFQMGDDAQTDWLMRRKM